MQLLLWLFILPSVISVPLSDFFDYNRVGSYCISSGRFADDEYLRRNGCDTILFPEVIDYELLFNLNIRFPFFNETVTAINVSVICIYVATVRIICSVL